MIPFEGDEVPGPVWRSLKVGSVCKDMIAKGEVTVVDIMESGGDCTFLAGSPKHSL